MSTGMIVTAALAVVVIAALWKLSRRRKTKPWIQQSACPQCGWTGQTSRYAGRCPRCNTAIGDQMGKHGARQ